MTSPFRTMTAPKGPPMFDSIPCLAASRASFIYGFIGIGYNYAHFAPFYRQRQEVQELASRIGDGQSMDEPHESLFRTDHRRLSIGGKSGTL
jgi:hypothetical protein